MEPSIFSVQDLAKCMEEFQADPDAPFGYVGLAFPSAKDGPPWERAGGAPNLIRCFMVSLCHETPLGHPRSSHGGFACWENHRTPWWMFQQTMLKFPEGT